MHEPLTAPEAEPASAPKPAGGRFTLERLSSAFARLMGAPAPPGSKPARGASDGEDGGGNSLAASDEAPVTPRMIVEGMLFVGGADGRALTSAEMASHMRNVTPLEVATIVAELQELYLRDGAAYEIVGDRGGHRLQLRTELSGVRERLRGQQRAARLTPAALEVLSVVAYRQGVTSEEINRLRGVQSYAILAQLVRRQLVRVDRPAKAPRAARYHTTERFNRLFGVTSPSDLPRSEDLEDS